MLENILPYFGIEASYSEKDKEYEQISVSDYVGMDVIKATAELNKAGIQYEIVGNGEKITAQMPRENSVIFKKSGNIILYTDNDTEAQTAIVPSVVGKTPEEANEILADSGFNIKIEGSKYYFEGGVATVESQYPAAGTLVPVGTVVTVNFGYYEDAE